MLIYFLHKHFRVLMWAGPYAGLHESYGQRVPGPLPPGCTRAARLPRPTRGSLQYKKLSGRHREGGMGRMALARRRRTAPAKY